MQFPLEIDGFKNRELVLEAGGFFSGPRLLLDGEPAPKQVQARPKKEFFLLRRDDGREVVAELLRAGNFLDSIPTVTVDGKIHEVVAPLPWYCWVWAAIPFGLVAIGGAVGGMIGGLATVINGRLLRIDAHPAVRFLATGMVTGLAFILWLALASWLLQAMGRA